MTMNRNTKFWISLAIFQVAFGFTVFALTREHYIEAAGPRVSAGPLRPMAPVQPGSIPQSDLAQFATATAFQTNSNDPVEIGRQADQFFANKQYDSAARLYERLVKLVPDNVDTYNNLGITLQYLGRSDEALRWLNEGVTVDAGYQRIWLTLGYVNIQAGNTEEARTALTKALEMNADNDIGQSAANMLAQLP
jgi:tetratricopeptide (TPR) repeat protein